MDLIRNSARGFAVDGIQVRYADGVFLRKNRADDIGQWGINAEPGVIDGGKNKAKGNGTPAQCLNVSCK